MQIDAFTNLVMQENLNMRLRLLLTFFQDLFGVRAVDARVPVGSQAVNLHIEWHVAVHFSKTLMYRLWQASMVAGVHAIFVDFGKTREGDPECLIIASLIKDFMIDLQIFGRGIKHLEGFIQIMKDGVVHSLHDISYWVKQADIELKMINCSTCWYDHNRNMHASFLFQKLLYQQFGAQKCDAKQIKYLLSLLGPFPFPEPISDDIDDIHIPGTVMMEDDTGYTWVVGLPEEFNNSDVLWR